MVERGSGSIVNLGSMSGIVVNRPQTASSYMASKGAVHMLTKALATEWADKGVRVNALAPGYVGTEMTLKMREQPVLFKAWHDHTPMGRLGEVEEIAIAALYLASGASSYVTGAILSIDGVTHPGRYSRQSSATLRTRDGRPSVASKPSVGELRHVATSKEDASAKVKRRGIAVFAQQTPNIRQLSHMQRTTGLTGCVAAYKPSGQGRLWAVALFLRFQIPFRRYGEK